VVEFWIARENQPSKLILSIPDYDLAHNNADDPAAKYGKLWLLPYNTGREADKEYRSGTTWYDDLIISQRRVPDPNVSSPNPPDSLSGTMSVPDRVELAWRSNSNNESEFRIERCEGAPYFCDYSQAFSRIGTAPANVEHYTDTRIRRGIAYTYRVRAHNASGDSTYSNNASNLPAPPSDLKATTSAGQVQLTWTDNSSDETRFNIERCVGEGCKDFAEIGQVGTDVSTFTDTSARSGNSYSYRVRSVNAAGSWKAWDTASIAYSNRATASIAH
jgi:hypothetical protein